MSGTCQKLLLEEIKPLCILFGVKGYKAFDTIVYWLCCIFFSRRR